jgi:hypothetical protein
MYCRDRSTTGKKIVVPGRFDRKRLEVAVPGPARHVDAVVEQADLRLRGAG